MNAILRKTEAGLQAIQAREGGTKLPGRLRTLLLQVDGQKSVEQLVQLAISLGSPAETVDKLLEMGLVEAIPGTETAPLAPSPREVAAAAMATVAEVKAPAPPPEPVVVTAPEPTPVAVAAPAAPAAQTEAHEDVPVSNKLPADLRPVAVLMRKVADAHLGMTAILLKRRISHSDNEKELRLALVALREALEKAGKADQIDVILQEVHTHLPMIGLNRAKSF